jgi:hypothetical protein
MRRSERVNTQCASGTKSSKFEERRPPVRLEFFAKSAVSNLRRLLRETGGVASRESLKFDGEGRWRGRRRRLIAFDKGFDSPLERKGEAPERKSRRDSTRVRLLPRRLPSS